MARKSGLAFVPHLPSPPYPATSYTRVVVRKLAWNIPYLMSDEKIIEIAGELDLGLKCFVHIKNGTLISYPDKLNYADFDPEEWADVMTKVEDDPDNYVEIQKMDTHESFSTMESFVDTIDDVRLRSKLIQVLSKPKPFKSFKFEIDNSGPYREQWFAFKNRRLFEWVKEQVTSKGL